MVTRWFKNRGWTVFQYQLDALAAYQRGESGLIHAPTGVGKTLAAWLPPVSEWLDAHPDPAKWPRRPHPFSVLWLTPLRALAGDTLKSLCAVTDAFGIPWNVQTRTGDTSSGQKARQRACFPTALVTTPESLSLLLSYAETRASFFTLKLVVVDEWHELLSTKRGVQTELALARIRRWVPNVRVWGLSATIGNLEEAMESMLGNPAVPLPVGSESRAEQALSTPGRPGGTLISAALPKTVDIRTVLPDSLDKFPWAGHLGLKLLPQVIEAIESANTTLVFTNVRSQTEIWFQAILQARPDWLGLIGIHHGSLDRATREIAEEGLRTGKLRAVVCTSSLDLGVDFSPVDQVIQIGGPKGVARLVQRAGRSGHRPGARSRVLCVPTHALELVEYAAARQVLQRRKVESRRPLTAPLDVLAQHLVTIALGGGFTHDELFDEIRTSHAYRTLNVKAYDWALNFVMHGGRSLRAYPEFCRVMLEEDRYVVRSRQIAHFHRLGIGTITSDQAINVQLLRGKRLGSVEESFISRLRPGSFFVFAGRMLQLVRVHQMTAHVRAAKKGNAAIPVWDGGRLPLSSLLADAVQEQLLEASNFIQGQHNGGPSEDVPIESFNDVVPEGKRRNKPATLVSARKGVASKLLAPPPEISGELAAVLPALRIQASWSHIPQPGELLIEKILTRDGTHWFLFPFGGRLAHEGVGALLAHRLARQRPLTLTVFVNDYGIQLFPASPLDISLDEWRQLLSPENLLGDLAACLNAGEMARRQFREIARIAGLIFQGFPGAGKPARQVQASSSLFFEVFSKYEPEHLLLEQARREVLDQQLEFARLRKVLEKASASRLVIKYPEKLTPMSFPLWAELVRGQVSSESWSERVRRMAADLEAEASHQILKTS